MKNKKYYFVVRDSLFVYDNSRWKTLQDTDEPYTDLVDIYGEVVKEDKDYIFVSSMRCRDGDMQNIVRIWKKCIVNKTIIK